ncbi:MAG: sugar transferase [Acidobacteria bacterium]|nr:MAG: sugar transferase [Acidobacteriota bacterium]
MHLYRRFGKRLFDIVASAVALTLLSPVIALVALMVRSTMGSPVLFRQRRPGLHGVPFVIFKFRTMRHEETPTTATDGARLDAFGQWLRATSLDELPQLVNVLKGDMSLVGPRPLLMQYLNRYTARQARRHDARPGLTGWAQVNGRNAISWKEKLEMDVWYVDRQSLLVDLAILARTAGWVLRRRGVNAPGEATISEFLGSGH